MCVGAFSVVTDPSGFNASHVEFRTGPRVDPDRLPPDRSAREIRLDAVEFFVGGNAAIIG
jgi:hypothetical protein